MPSQVRIISKRNSAEWDRYVRDAITSGRWGIEHDYFGCPNQANADHVRRCLRTAAQHQGVGKKVYYKECPSPGKCRNGGPDCQYHVYYTIYDLEVARRYKQQQAATRRK